MHGVIGVWFFWIKQGGSMEKYTVIIPTRDRAETLGATLRTCLRQAYENFEVIVSDNCSDDNTKEIVEGFHDPRIKYINPGRRLSMSGNFEFALSHVSDGFIMFIGSDDGILPDAIQYVDSIVQRYKVEAVSCRQATYVWPNFSDKTIAGRLVFGGSRSDIEIRASKEWIEKALSFESHYCFDLPNLYCGFVHKRLIDRAYKDGVYFRSITPDAYSAFATAIFVDSYAFSNRPFSIAGASAKSNGASSLHSTGDNKEASKFYSENDIELCEGFVNCPSYEVIGAETFAQVAKAFPEQCAKYRIDYEAMLQGALKNTNPRTVNEVTNAVKIMAKNFSVKNIEDSIPCKKSLNLARKLRTLSSLISNYFEIIEIQKSYLYGIKDIDDAALAAYLFIQCHASSAFISRKDIIFRRFNRLPGS
jgi:glycosyltransferase involved in cell wall biosynthesis